MSIRSFDRRIWLILAGLGVLLALVVLAGSLAGLAAPGILPEDGLVGINGPITLVFAERMQPESVANRLAFDPPLAGRFAWAGLEGQPDRVVSFWPDAPLQPGQAYAVRLAAGAMSRSGLTLRGEHTWQVTVRAAEVLYLSPVENPDLWRVTADGSVRQQLTRTGGDLFDYAVSPDGQQIIYSAYNEQSGVDLWQISRDGGEAELLLPCQSDWCVNPAYSPDGRSIAYSRRQSGALAGEGPGVPRIWLLDLSALTTEILFANPDVGGYEPAWSPDGRYLAFFDGVSGGVRVFDVTAKTDFLLSSQMGMTGAWSPDSRSLIFTDLVGGETAAPYVAVYLADVQTQQVRRVLADDPDQLDYSNPVWNVDGDGVVVALRPLSGGPSKQIWLIPLDGEGAEQEEGQPERQPVTEEPQFTHAGYRWDPSSERLVFQRLKLGASAETPQVAVWERASQETVILAENAYQPGWLP